jgi:hypothetical protein
MKMARRSSFVRIALLATAVAAISLVLFGELLVLGGNAKIADANAWVNQQNSRGCGGAPCAILAPGIDQPGGQAGAQEVALGQELMIAGLIPALGFVGAVMIRVKGRRSS